MAILAECDICGCQHRVKEGMVGNSIRCKDCGTQFVVAGGPSISPETYLEEGGRLRLREPDDQTNSGWSQMVAAIVAGLVLVALVGAIWTMIRLIRPTPKAVVEKSVSNRTSSCPAREESVHREIVQEP